MQGIKNRSVMDGVQNITGGRVVQNKRRTFLSLKTSFVEFST